MSDFVDQAISALRRYNIPLGPGLSDTEVCDIECEFEFKFLPVHRELLQAALPGGSVEWMNWRDPNREAIREQLDWPVKGIVMEAEAGEFWPRSWGIRPTDPLQAAETARVRMTAVPKLVPIFIHRFLPASPAPMNSPVFSVYGSDVVFYGENLLDYIFKEFGPYFPFKRNTKREYAVVPFWSDLAKGKYDTDL